MSRNDLNERALAVRMLLMDVDGVLTDGRIWFVPSPEGLVEVKAFHVSDGAGIFLARRGGLLTGWVSGRASGVVLERARELGIEEVHLGVREKAAVLSGIVERTGIPPEEMAFIGDEVVDLPVLGRVGLALTVPNASEDVRSRVHYVTRAEGGAGAVREVVELILKAQGKWEGLVAEFLA